MLMDILRPSLPSLGGSDKAAHSPPLLYVLVSEVLAAFVLILVFQAYVFPVFPHFPLFRNMLTILHSS